MRTQRMIKGARASGFTLIELMIVVAIIGILAAIAIPKFANLIRKSSEGASKGNVGSIRSALSIYYGDMEGQYPADLSSLTVAGKYLSSVPAAKAPNYHADQSAVVQTLVATDPMGWLYNNVAGEPEPGAILVNSNPTRTQAATCSTAPRM